MSLKHYALLPLLFLSRLVLHSAQEPKVGFFVLNCTGTEPKVRFHEKGNWYHVDCINYYDHKLKSHLESNNCASSNNFTEKIPPFLYINVTGTPQFFKCKRKTYSISESNFLGGFHNYTSCKDDHDLYFYGDPKKSLPSLPETMSKHCLPVLLPSSGLNNVSALVLTISNLTLLWHPDFFITWQVHRHCLDCHLKGDQCLSSQNGTFECGELKKPEEGNKGVMKALIGTGIGIGFLITCIIFLLYQRRERNKLSSSSTLISRDISNEKGSIYFQTTIFTYKQLDEATNHFDSSKELGDGAFGTVYLGKLRDGRVVAVKRLFEHNYKRVEQFMNEIEILSRLRHQNLVSLYGCTSQHSRELLLVYEYVPNGTVADHLHGERAKATLLTWPIRMSIAIESADALTYLHASEIIHRDVKTNNILLDNSFHVKVADFGLSRLFPTDVTHVSTAPQGTPGYVDPEYYQCYQLNNKSDVYSFGVVLIELISSKPAVDIGRHRYEINLANMAINRIQTRSLHELVDPSLGFESDDNVRNMITSVAELGFRCLQQENEMRPCMVEVLETLRGIESEEYKKKMPDEMDISAPAPLLKNS